MTEKDFRALIDRVVAGYHGDAVMLSHAFGALAIGRLIGWKPLFLVHSKKTIRNYEMVLGVRLRKVMPEVGMLADRLVAWRACCDVSNYWRTVNGENKDIIRGYDWRLLT